MKFHELKSWPDGFQAVVNGHKRFEVRRDDRGFEEGDLVNLREFVMDTPEAILEEQLRRTSYGVYGDVKPGYTGRSVGPFRIGYLARSACLPEGWCAFELIRLAAKELA